MSQLEIVNEEVLSDILSQATPDEGLIGTNGDDGDEDHDDDEDDDDDGDGDDDDDEDGDEDDGDKENDRRFTQVRYLKLII